MIEGARKESEAYCRQVDPNFDGFGTVWPGTVPETKGVTARDMGEVTPSTPRAPAAGPDVTSLSPFQSAHVRGHEMVERFPGVWGFAVGFLLSVAIYWRGFNVARRIVSIPPIKWVHAWLVNRMFFDEMYDAVFVWPTLEIANLAGWVDRQLIDRLVNAAAGLVALMSRASGLFDRLVVDGFVNGVANATSELGAIVRAPQNGRIRVYVTVSVAAIALCMLGVMLRLLIL